MTKHILAILVATTLAHRADCAKPADYFGSNLVQNDGFEDASSDLIPTGWTIRNSGNEAQVSVEADNALAGKNSLKISMPDSIDAGESPIQVTSDRISVTPGHRYLFSVAFRQEGMSVLENDRYSFKGVAAEAAVSWLGSDDRVLKTVNIGLPYGPCNWDIRDQILQAPDDACAALVHLVFGNKSLAASGTNIPSTIWWDAIQFRDYTPPSGPQAVLQSDSQVVHPGADPNWQTGVQNGMYQADADPAATGGTVQKAAVGAAGWWIHSPHLTLPDGLYRINVRLSIPDTSSDDSVGFVDVSSQHASTRAKKEIVPSEAPEIGKYADIPLDFIVRGNGWTIVRAHTEGNQAWKIDSIEIVPLVQFSEEDMQQIYPGYDAALSGYPIP